MIAAADANGFIMEACELVIKPETVDSERFKRYLLTFIVLIMQPYDQRHLRQSVIMQALVSINWLSLLECFNISFGEILFFRSIVGASMYQHK